MKNLLTFAAAFALGVSALQFVPGVYPLPSKSSVPAPARLSSAAPIGDQLAGSEAGIRVRTEYVFVSPYVTEADLRQASHPSEEMRRAEYESKTIAR